MNINMSHSINKQFTKQLQSIILGASSSLLVLALTACGGGGGSSSDNSSTVDETQTPTLPTLTTKPRPSISTSFIPASVKKPYTLELARWNIKNNGDTAYATANTDAMQNAIDWADANGYDGITVPAGNYLIGKYGNAVYQAGITLPSNMVFELDKDATIEMHTNDKWNYCLIDVREKKNVVIRGGTLKGDRDSHIYTPRDSDGKAGHDEGHLICVQHESENVLVENMTLTHATGDGILLVGHKGAGSFVNNVIIRKNNVHNNRRQGVSIVGGQNVLIEDNEIHRINGVSPQFGIDIESGIYTSANIIIRRNNFHHNRGGDIVNTDGANVWIENNTMHQGEGNKYIDGPLVWHRNVDMSILNNDITMLTTSANWWWGMISYAKEYSAKNTATTYIENNTCNGCGIYTRYHHGLVMRNNKVSDRPVLVHYIKNMKLEDNKLIGGASWFDAEYRLKQVSGSASGNTLDGVLQDIKLSYKPTNHNIDGDYWK